VWERQPPNNSQSPHAILVAPSHHVAPCPGALWHLGLPLPCYSLNPIRLQRPWNAHRMACALMRTADLAPCAPMCSVFRLRAARVRQGAGDPVIGCGGKGVCGTFLVPRDCYVCGCCMSASMAFVRCVLFLSSVMLL